MEIIFSLSLLSSNVNQSRIERHAPLLILSFLVSRRENRDSQDFLAEQVLFFALELEINILSVHFDRDIYIYIIRYILGTFVW